MRVWGYGTLPVPVIEQPGGEASPSRIIPATPTACPKTLSEPYKPDADHLNQI